MCIFFFFFLQEDFGAQYNLYYWKLGPTCRNLCREFTSFCKSLLKFIQNIGLSGPSSRKEMSFSSTVAFFVVSFLCLAAQCSLNLPGWMFKWVTRWISPQGRSLFLQSSRNVSVNIVNSNNQLLTQLVTGKTQQDPHQLLSWSSLMFLLCDVCSFKGISPDDVYISKRKQDLTISP